LESEIALMTNQMFTHKGWFMWCPIKVANPDSDAPVLAARWLILEPWFTVNEAWQNLMIFVLSTINPEFEPMFMFKITGELKK
jgi:hypothetical protein